MTGLKVALPIAVAIFFAALFIASGLSMEGTTVTEIDTQTQTTTAAATRLPRVTTTVLDTITETNTQDRISTVTTALTEESTVMETSVPKGTPVSVTLIVTCTTCEVGPLSRYEYSGTATNGTTNNQGSTPIQGDGTSTYVFMASPSQIASGSWSVEWNVYMTGNTGALEVKAYFNGLLVSDKTSPSSAYRISDSISINVY
ncbi:MAG TPA: hypothetical protein VEC02_02135 [Nitrososphaerales archaeon]|nr:hypothetical protein [Nitrososphaerales archaeon]